MSIFLNTTIASAKRRTVSTPVPSQGVYITSLGAASDGITDDVAIINNALLTTNTIIFPANTVTLIGSAISIPSNRKLIIETGAEIKLKSGAADYMFYNSDFVNGNSNITIEGAGFTSIINGNKTGGQTRRLAASLDKSNYWGFGMWFVKVEGLTVNNFKVNETEAWGIAHYDCNNVLFEDIKFDQKVQGGNNGDGITGFSSNIVIRNISGYTNDDMIFIGAGGGSIGLVQMELIDIDIENILIENITGEQKNGNNAWRGVRVSGRDNHTITNIVIKNVTGAWQYEAVEIGNFWANTLPGLFITDITLDGIQRNPTSTARNTVYFFSSTIGTANIYNLTAEHNLSEATIGTGSGGSCVIDNLNIDGATVVNKSGSDTPSMLYDTINIKNISLENIIYSSDPLTDYSGYVYRKTSGFATKLNFTNVQLNQNLVRKGIGLNGGNNLSVNGTSVYVDKAELDPITGDTVLDITSGIVTWNGTAWV